MKVVRVSQPTVEPISLSEAKDHLRVTHTDDDDLIAVYISAARNRVEDYCNRAFVSAGFAALYTGNLPNSLAPVPLPIAGATSLEVISYRDDAGAVQALDVADFELDAERMEIRPDNAWPSGADLRVEVLAGDDTTTPEIPAAIRAAILLYLGDLYDLRQSHVVGESIAPNPAAQMLMDPYRVRMGI